MIIAAEMGHVAPHFRTGDSACWSLAAILSGLREGDVLFIDEIHRLARTTEKCFTSQWRISRVDVVVGKVRSDVSSLTLPPFTVVGATTRSGLLPAPLVIALVSPLISSFIRRMTLKWIVRRSAKLSAPIVQRKQP